MIIKMPRWMVLCLTALSFGAASAETIKVGTVPWIGWSTLNVAESLGYWEDLGVDVEIKTYESSIALNEAFKNNQVHITMELLGTAVQWQMEGLDVRILAETDWSHGGDKIIAKQGKTLESLKGQTIGTYLDSPAVLYFLYLYLRSKNLSLNDFKIKRFEADALLKEFIEGRLEAMVNFDPNTIDAVRQGNGAVVVNSGKFLGSMPEGMVIKSDTLEKLDHDHLVRFFRGYVRAANWLNQQGNWKRFSEILNEHTFAGQEPYRSTALSAMLSSVKIHNQKVLLTRNKENGGLERFLNDIKSFLKKSGRLENDFDVPKMVATDAILEALQ